MSRENNKVPRLRFPEFRGVGDWEEKRLGEVCEMQAGNFVHATNIYEEQELDLYPCYGGNGLRGYTKSYTHEGKYSLIGRQGALCGNVNLVSENFHATEHAVVTVSKKGIDTDWLFYLLSYSNLNQYATGQAQPGLSVDNLERVTLKLPSLQEQRKIAACLSSLDELITAQTQKLAHLKTHKKGLMQQLFPAEGETLPRLRFPEFCDAGDWESRELGEFISERSEHPNDKIPLYSLTIEDGVTQKTERYERSFLVKNKKEAYKLVHPNDFAFNPMNLRFGAIARHSGTEKVALSKYYNIFYCDKTVDSVFCNIYFRSGGMMTHYDNMAIGSLIEKRRVHFKDFLRFNICFPTLPEQQKIADCLSSLDELITAQTQKLAHLKTHKKGLMQQLFPATDEVNG